MNILVDKLPTDYKGLKINTNFRSFILFELLMQDRGLSNEDKICLALKLFYEEPPKDLKKAIEGILWFYSRGEKKEPKKEGKSDKKQIYSYEYDANLIYSAFWHDYRLDLNEVEYLHWFKFKSLFDGLNEKNTICKYMGYRAVDLSKIKDKDEKKRYKNLKQQCALPDERTEEEKEQDFAEAFW
jgi:hypothetical protein